MEHWIDRLTEISDLSFPSVTVAIHASRIYKEFHREFDLEEQVPVVPIRVAIGCCGSIKTDIPPRMAPV